MLFFNKISKSRKLLWFKTTVITAMAASVLAFSYGPAAFADTSKLNTIYQVYVNGTYIGNITDKSVVNNLMDEQVDQEKSFRDDDLTFTQQVFPSSVNNQKTIQTMKDTFQLQAEASAIMIDGAPVVYLETKEAAEDVLQQLKFSFVTAGQLKELEERKLQENPSLPALKENETRLIDVELSKNVSIEEKNIAPEKIMSAEDAVKYLQKGTLEEKKYRIQEGDVLETIVQKNHLKMADVLKINPGLTEDTLIKIGQEINITVPKPFIEVIVDKEVNQKEVLPFANQVIEDSSLPKGESREKQQGQNGSRQATYFITEQNGSAVKKELKSQQIEAQPINHIVVKGTKMIPSRGEGSLAWPAVGGYVSSKQGYRWGKMHKGIDIARPSDRTIKAADNGVVVSAGWGGGYGNKIVIDHQNGYRTLYGHMSSLKVTAGQVVSKGTAIGIMGATGDATGVHLHFEVFKNGKLVNPLSYLK